MKLPFSRRIPKTFSLTVEDVELLDILQNRLSLTGRLVSESETVRAALQALKALPDDAIDDVLVGVERKKPGRAKGGKTAKK